MTTNDKIYSEVTDRIIVKLEAGTIPWRQPWSSSVDREFGGQPRNLVSKKAYRGINSIMLATSGFQSPWWMTFNQAKELGGHVRAGSKSEMIVFFKKLTKLDRSGKPVYDEAGRAVTIPLLRYSRVFNLEQIEGIAAPVGETPVAPGDAAELDDTIAQAKAIADAADLCAVHNGGSKACYSPALDTIRMPAIKDFDSSASYYHTLFHELVHATGHPTRLNRLGGKGENKFGGEDYFKEELIAEIGAAFVSNVAGILCDVRFEGAAGYIANWLEVLKNDHKFVVQAASAAQRAADLILHVSQEPAAA